MHFWRFSTSIAFALFLTISATKANEPDFIAFSAGVFDFGKNQKAAEARIEYRSDIRMWIFKPLVGAMLTSDSGSYGYAGVLVDMFLNRRTVASISFAPGIYAKGKGKNLGNELEFRSQLELAYRFDDRSRFGLAFSHMSNASIGNKNPGSESLMLVYAIPFHNFLGDK